MYAFGYPNADTMRRLADQVPEKGEICVRNRSCDISWSIAETDGKYLCCGRHSQERRTESKYSPTICRCAFGKDDHNAFRVLLKQ